MAQVFVAHFKGITFAANKNMATVLNTSPSEVIRILRITALNNQSNAAAGVLGLCNIFLYTTATLTGHTTVNSISYNSSNTSPTGVTAGHAGTLGGTANLIKRFVCVGTNPAISGARINEFLAIPDLSIVYKWNEHVDVQPITLRQNQMISLVNNATIIAGTIDVIIEYEKI